MAIVISVNYFAGIDIPQLYTVINYGIPTDLDQYTQESGRIGRDGRPSTAIVLYHSHSLKGKHMTEECKKYVSASLCRREQLLNFYEESIESPYEPQHLCCDVCTKICKCGIEHSTIYSQPELFFSNQRTADDTTSDSSDDSQSGYELSLADVSIVSPFPQLTMSSLNESV